MIKQRDEIQGGRNLRHKIGLRPNYYLYLLDMIALALIALIVYNFIDLGDTPDRRIRYCLATVIAMSSYSVFGFANGVYDWHGFRRHLKTPFSTFGGLIFTFGTLLIIAFAFKVTNDFSRFWVTLWFVVFSVHILITRVALYWYLSDHSRGRFIRRQTVILGAGENGQGVLDQLVRFDDQEIEVIGFLDDRATRLPKVYRDVPVLGDTNMIESLVRERGIDLVIIALPWKAYERIEYLMQKLSSWRVDVYLAPDRLGLQYADRPVFRVGGMQVLSLQERPISEWEAVVKRIEDLCIAIPASIVLLPLLAVVAIAIKIESKGSVLFIQERYGFNNNIIKVYKFRSMYFEKSDLAGCQHTVKDDPRVTRVGRFIRKTSIDELPQLFNVLLGNMSIVGPRPHATGMQAHGQMLPDLLQGYASRHRVKPGMTGWAQCNGWRGEADTMEKLLKRIEFDLYYIENWSVYLDLLTILKTVKIIVKGDVNAF